MIRSPASVGAMLRVVRVRRRSPKRAGTPDEVGNVAALLVGAEGAFITRSDFLMDGGVTSSYWFGELASK